MKIATPSKNRFRSSIHPLFDPRLALAILAAFLLPLFQALPAFAQGRDHGSHGGSAQSIDHQIIVARGTLTELNPSEGTVVIDHEAIPAVGWEAMVMPFELKDGSLFEGLKKGDRVRFDLTVVTQGDKTVYFISDIEAE
ncbi:MAG: copper-binding protein [Deltaproteobacteria bacterium]|jgi:Cu/Ag efflux protein CusF|nr:copper-binding protein [Deltaproteobacteria bacterium]